jgi:hypothetical protein
MLNIIEVFCPTTPSANQRELHCISLGGGQDHRAVDNDANMDNPHTTATRTHESKINPTVTNSERTQEKRRTEQETISQFSAAAAAVNAADCFFLFCLALFCLAAVVLQRHPLLSLIHHI